jgi:alpha-amylase
MTAVVFYFQAHQPYRLRKELGADGKKESALFDDGLNAMIARRVAERCYLPMNELLLEAIERTEGKLRCAFSLSGTLLEQLERWAPPALESFVALAGTGCVEFLCETAFHSIASLACEDEFRAQVDLHRRRIADLFGTEPVTFRNTELILDERTAKVVEDLGFDLMLGEGADRLLRWRSPQVVYAVRGCARLKLLLRSYALSDDIAFRFSNRLWPEYPLFADRFAAKLGEANEEAHFIGLFLDYETFGEHQWAETGIFEFMQHLPELVLANPRLSFRTPREVAASVEPVAALSIPDPVSWADAERAGRGDLLEAWRALTTSDHVYYMATKWLSDNEVHEYFCPHETPHQAYITFMRALGELRRRIDRAGGKRTSLPS